MFSASLSPQSCVQYCSTVSSRFLYIACSQYSAVSYQPLALAPRSVPSAAQSTPMHDPIAAQYGQCKPLAQNATVLYRLSDVYSTFVDFAILYAPFTLFASVLCFFTGLRFFASLVEGCSLAPYLGR